MLFLIALLNLFPTHADASLQAIDGPNIIGNGGDVLEENPVSIAFLQNLLQHSQLFIGSWARGLDIRMNLDNGLKGTLPSELPIPLGAEKLFPQDRYNSAYKKLKSLTIVFKTNSVCPSENGHTDGSVLSKERAKICISGFSMSKKLNEGNAKVQLEALIVHELHHLMEGSEEEAISAQSQYIDEMRFVSKESIERLFSEREEAMVQTQHELGNLLDSANNYLATCENIEKVRVPLEKLTLPSFAAQFHSFRATDRDLFDDLYLILSAGVDRFVCSQINPKLDDPNGWMEQYKKGFGGRDTVEVKEFMKNLGFEETRYTTTHTNISMLHNADELKISLISLWAEIERAKGEIRLYQLEHFPVILDEKP